MTPILAYQASQKLPDPQQIRGLLDLRNSLHDQLRDASGTLSHINMTCERQGFGSFLNLAGYRSLSENFGAFIDKGMWGEFAALCGSHFFVDTTLATKIPLQGTDPAFNAEQVDQVMDMLKGEFADGLPRAVKACAGHLCGGPELLPAFRCENLFYKRDGLTGGWYLKDRYNIAMLDQLHRLLCLADGQPMPTAEDLPSNWLSHPDMDAASFGRYLALKRCKNGTLRGKITRPELAADLNVMADLWLAARLDKTQITVVMEDTTHRSAA